MKVHTKCCNTVNPVGVTEPTFTWYLTGNSAEFQKAYEINVFDGNYTWCSGVTESSDSVRVICQGLVLKSNRKYFYNVKVFTDKGEYTSDTGWFITGFVGDTDLKWITAEPSISSPLLRKEFDIEYIPEYVVANVCGLGFFELYINGEKVSDDLMQPVRTDYDTVIYRNLPNEFNSTTRKSVHYVSYEISKYLVKGKNTVVLWLGNGWYRESARATIRGEFDYGNNLKAFLRISGENLLVETDETWQYAESPIIHNNLFSGEIYDASRYNAAFFRNGYVTENYARIIDAPHAKLISQSCLGERVIKVLPVKCIKEDIYDSGEVISGFAKIKLKGAKGEKVEIFYAEDFDGEKLNYTSTVGYVEADLNQIQKDVYISDGSDEQVYVPRFVWHTYRYIYIRHSENVEITDVESLFVCTDMPKRASFECSDKNVNAIYKMYENTVLSNLHGAVPMDCPHRERLPYTGDGQLSANAAVYNYDAYETYKKWITDINDSQDSVSGFVPYTAPYSGGCGGHAWGSAVVTVPWHFYLQYGDREFLKKSIPHIEKWIAYLEQHKDEKGFVDRHIEGSWSLGDWVMPSKFPWSDPKPEAIKIHPKLVNTVYYIYCIDLYLKMCKVLGIKADEKLYREIEECTDTLYNEYVYSDGVFDEQEADAYLLYADVVKGAKAEETLASLIEKIQNRGYTFNSGMVGTEILFKVLDKADKNDVALKMLMATKYPSIGYMLENGATTLWETWEGTGARSHTAFTSVGAWYIYGIAGIKPHGGYKTFTVKPLITEELTYVDAKLQTEYGEICVNWKRENDSISLCVRVPFNTTAKLILSGSEIELTCGEHHFQVV